MTVNSKEWRSGGRCSSRENMVVYPQNICPRGGQRRCSDEIWLPGRRFTAIVQVLSSNVDTKRATLYIGGAHFFAEKLDDLKMHHLACCWRLNYLGRSSQKQWGREAALNIWMSLLTQFYQKLTISLYLFYPAKEDVSSLISAACFCFRNLIQKVMLLMKNNKLQLTFYIICFHKKKHLGIGKKLWSS